MNKHILFCLSSLLLLSAKVGAQDSFTVRAQRYIEQYYSLAILEQQRAGIPASVTLAQGVLETEAGKSELACAANNHFGIKCKPDYEGAKFFHDDDAPKECFKMYRSAEESYKDHSDYLKRNQRYAPLFSLTQTDYASWATCLRKCGYATNPQYAQRLIKIIEDFKLQRYTYAAMDSSLLPNQPVVLKNAPQLREEPRKKTPAVADTSKKIVLTTFDPVDKSAPVAKQKPAVVEQPKVVVPQPVVEVSKPVVVEQPKPVVQEPVAQEPKHVVTTNSFAEIKKIADSTHHIIANDGPMMPQAHASAIADTPTTVAAAQPSIDTKYDSGKIITVNGLKAFYAYKGEMLLQYAVQYNVRYPHLLELNDLDDKPLESNMPIYLEKKLSTGTHARHTVKAGETVFQIAQAEGMQMKRLLALNMMDIGDEPAEGVILELQNGVFRKPALRAIYAEAPSATTIMLGKSTPPSDYISVPKTKQVVKVADPAKDEVEPVKEPVKPVAEITPTKPEVVVPHYVETIPAPKATIPDTTAVARTPAPKEPVKPVVTAPAHVEPTPPSVANVVKQSAAPALKEDTTVDELANLKAELDKVVYTDDSKLIPVQPTKPVKPAVITKPESKKEAAKQKAKKKKGDDDDDDDEEDNKKGSSMYTIKDGETLGGIANRHNTTVKKLMALNHISATQIRAGKKIRVK